MRERDRSDEGRNLKFRRSVDEETDRVARVSNKDMRLRIMMPCMGDFLEPTAARDYASGT